MAPTKGKTVTGLQKATKKGGEKGKAGRQGTAGSKEVQVHTSNFFFNDRQLKTTNLTGCWHKRWLALFGSKFRPSSIFGRSGGEALICWQNENLLISRIPKLFFFFFFGAVLGLLFNFQKFLLSRSCLANSGKPVMPPDEQSTMR